MKFYGVWAGHKKGVFTDWNECSKSIGGFKGAKFKKLDAKNKADAEIEFSKGYTPKSKAEKTSSSDKTAKKSSSKKVQNLHKQDGFVLFTDGACRGNPGESGSGFVVYENGNLASLFYGKYDALGTNNTAEFEAIICAMRYINKKQIKAKIYVDSQYVIDCITKWSNGWSRNGWKKSNKESVENLELVQKAFELYKTIKSGAEILKVKAHIGEEGNEIADRMAIFAVKTKELSWKEYKSKDIEEILKLKHE